MALNVYEANVAANRLYAEARISGKGQDYAAFPWQAEIAAGKICLDDLQFTGGLSFAMSASSGDAWRVFACAAVKS